MPSSRNKRFLAILVFAAPLSGCADYLNNRDTITFGAGNAMDANAGINTLKPFPPEAQHTHIDADGKVVYRVIRTYQHGPGTEPPFSSQPGSTISAPGTGPAMNN